MKKWKLLIGIHFYSFCGAIMAQEYDIPFKSLKIFNGNTHAHSIFTYSHGNHLQRHQNFVKGDKVLFIDSLYISRPKNSQLKKEWNSFQGLPKKHYEEAVKAGFDFYCVTDHSQEEAFFPNSNNNTAWAIATKNAEDATNTNFSAFMGVEHSENDSDNGRGHFNVIGSSTYINAIKPGVDIPYFYNWLKENPKNLITGNPVAVSFNHPNIDQFNNWDYRDEEITEIITLLEIINNQKLKYEGFLAALDKGWRVSPVAGIDNHNYTEIHKAQSRTFVLAKKNTPKSILTAMRARRTYASFDKNLECRYSVNDSLMGSIIPQKKLYHLKVYVNDPTTDDESDKISKIDIVTRKGKVIKSFELKRPQHKYFWNITIKDKDVDQFLFIRVWDNTKSINTQKPVAFLAPIWVSKQNN